MIRRFAICCAFGLFAATPSLAQAPQAAPGALPPHEIVTMLRSTAFDPIGRPVRQGGAYVVRAFDRYGEEVRVTVDARNGRIRKVALVDDVPRFAEPAYRGPRIVLPSPYYGPGPRVVRVLPDHDDPGPVYGPRIYEGDPRGPRPPSALPAPSTRAAARPPLPRSRPSEAATGSVPQPASQPQEPASQQPAPAESNGTQTAPNRDGETPPPVGFE